LYTPQLSSGKKGITHQVFSSFNMIDAKQITEYGNNVPVLCSEKMWY
jgi:hypothetical protein